MDKFDKIQQNVILLFNEKIVDLLFHVSIMMDQTTKHENHLSLYMIMARKLKIFKFFSKCEYENI